jgi:hypothetical protein
MRSPLPVYLAACLQVTGSLAAADTRSLQAHRVTDAIDLDGRLSEAAWEKAAAASGFTVQWPEFGRSSALPTEVRVLYDDQYLYVGARLFHPQGGQAVKKRIHRRDQWSSSDWFIACIDSLHDRNSAGAFLVNAAGVQRDAAISGDTNWDYNWDGVWESSVAQDETGWSAELKIPLSLLRTHPGGGPQTWGINFIRESQGSIRESSVWELTPRGTQAFVSRFPELTGLDGLKPHARREWAPFVSLRRKFETAASYDDRGWQARGGLDAHMSINTYSQLDFTIRPDFGQVEVDQASVNLSTFETWLPEKRAFFLEGMDIFQVAGPQLFYSRRIGSGLWDPALDEGERLVDRPQASEIAGAAKFTSKFEGGLNLGVLGASVETARALIQEPDGRQESRVMAPSANYGVARATQRLDNRGSYIGAFLSHLNQSGVGGRSALVSAVDAAYKSEDRSTVVDATFSRSQAGPKEDQDQGHRERIALNRRWASGWWMGLGGVNASRQYTINDMGFLGRADEQRFDASLGKSWDRTWNAFRNWSWSMGGGVAQDQEGQVFQRSLWSWFGTGFTNFWGMSVNAGADLPANNDRELRTFSDPEKKYLRTETTPYVGIGLNTPDNQPWHLQVNCGRGWREGGPSTWVNLYQSIKLNSALELQLSTGSSQNEGELSYLETQGTTPIVGLRQLSQFNQTLRLAYAVSPNLTFQVFSQWLEANWNFRDLKAYEGEDVFSPAVPSAAPAYSSRIWNANLITRWEFQPGSTFYLVYTHGAATDALINDRAAISPRQDLQVLNQIPSDDVVQVKLSYLFR